LKAEAESGVPPPRAKKARKPRTEQRIAGRAARLLEKGRDTGQTAAATDGDGGAARAAAGAEPAATKKKARKPRSEQRKAKKAERNAKRFG
jgi:hypothetical protein